MNYKKEIKRLKEKVNELESNVVILNEDGLLTFAKYEKELKEKKFTEDEKAILRNLPEFYKWIVRNKCGQLYISSDKPIKSDIDKCWVMHKICYFYIYEHLFKSIKWEDEEPCEFRKYV